MILLGDEFKSLSVPHPSPFLNFILILNCDFFFLCSDVSPAIFA